MANIRAWYQSLQLLLICGGNIAVLLKRRMTFWITAQFVGLISFALFVFQGYAAAKPCRRF